MNVSYNILFLIKSLYLIRRPRFVFTLYLYIVGIKDSNSSHYYYFFAGEGGWWINLRSCKLPLLFEPFFQIASVTTELHAVGGVPPVFALHYFALQQTVLHEKAGLLQHTNSKGNKENIMMWKIQLRLVAKGSGEGGECWTPTAPHPL